jgi:hypothetical protein
MTRGWAATNGPPIELPDKSVLLVAYAGYGAEEGKKVLGVFRSADRGATWKNIATLSAEFDLDEPSQSADQTPDRIGVR